MPTRLDLVPDLAKLCPHSLRDGLAPAPKAPVLPRPTDVGEAEIMPMSA
jgi:hypothetical protein